MTRTAGAVATPHHLATRAGERALGEGGTAVDACIAAAAVLAVVYPHMCALGGDVQALLARPDGSVQALNGSGAAARKATAAALAPAHSSMPIHGVHPITVPGLVAAWGDLHAAGGRLPWSSLFRDALAFAEDGVPVAAALGRDLAALYPRLSLDTGMRRVFFNADGQPLAAGQMLRQPALAASLRSIAEGGARRMYEGALAVRLVAGLRRLGSALDIEDFAAHRSEWLAPLTGHFADLEILTAPPLSQGYVLLQLLASVQKLGLGATDPLGSNAAVLARLCFLTAQGRDGKLGDPRHVVQDVEQWLSDESIQELADIAADRSQPLTPASPQPRPDGDTVAIVAMDSDGVAVSLIQSIFHAFGSGILEPDTGIICHNRGAAFTLTPGPAQLVGGRRPPSTLTPALVMRGGRVEAAVGAMGGKSQPQILLQLLLRLVAGTAPAEAVAVPRWVVGEFGARDESVVLVEGAVSQSTRSVLSGAGLPLATGGQRDDRAGHAQIVRHASAGCWESATDPRGDGRGPD
jgi:gamma-glutamyltranspeptidase